VARNHGLLGRGSSRGEGDGGVRFGDEVPEGVERSDGERADVEKRRACGSGIGTCEP